MATCICIVADFIRQINQTNIKKNLYLLKLKAFERNSIKINLMSLISINQIIWFTLNYLYIANEVYGYAWGTWIYINEHWNNQH